MKFGRAAAMRWIFFMGREVTRIDIVAAATQGITYHAIGRGEPAKAS
jgi:hypothetical protein